MSYLFSILFCFCESFWRRWFGGGYIGGKQKENSWYNRRITQHIVGFLVLFSALYFIRSFNILSCLVVSGIIQGLFWSVGHGPAFDISRAGKPDEKLVARYKKEFWNKICEFLVPQEYWYGYGYDFLWMLFRYTVYLIPLIFIFGFDILLLGICIPFIYSFCWSLFERFPKYFNNRALSLNGPTSVAEYICGLVTGLFLMFC